MVTSMQSANPNVRKGRFLWMEDTEKKSFLEELQQRIQEGYYYRDDIIARVVDEIAPVLGDIVGEQAA